MSVIHLKPPRRHQAPGWLKQPLGRFQSPQLPWPRAWAALLLLLSGMVHLARAGWVVTTTGQISPPVLMIGLFGIAYVLLGLMLRKAGGRALVYATAVTALGLTLGTISFVVSFDHGAGVNWSALVMRLLDVLILPLTAAGLRLPAFRRSATRHSR